MEYEDLIDGLLNKLVSRHYEKEKFYNDLWDSVVGSDLLFDEKQTKIYALGRIWSDPRIPYFQVEAGIKMSNEEFIGIIEKKKELLQEASFILSCKYEQRTEASSVLLGVLDRCENDKEKAVVMAKIIDYIEKRTMFNMMNSQ